MSRQRTMSRLHVLEARQPGAYPRGLVARLARQYDLSEAELIAEAEQLVRRFAEAGATTRQQQVRLVAEEQGIPVAELEAELRAILAEDQ